MGVLTLLLICLSRQVRCLCQPSHDFWRLNPVAFRLQVEPNPYPSSVRCNFSAETAGVSLSPVACHSPPAKMQLLI